MTPIISLHTEGLTIYEHIDHDVSGKKYYEYYINDKFVFGIYDRFGVHELMRLYLNGYFNFMINEIRKEAALK